MGAVRVPKLNKRGQTMVEYLMLLVVVVALFFFFQTLGVPWLNDIFSASKSETESTAMRGGEAAVQNYYADSNKKVVGR